MGTFRQGLDLHALRRASAGAPIRADHRLPARVGAGNRRHGVGRTDAGDLAKRSRSGEGEGQAEGQDRADLAAAESGGGHDGSDEALLRERTGRDGRCSRTRCGRRSDSDARAMGSRRPRSISVRRTFQQMRQFRTKLVKVPARRSAGAGDPERHHRRRWNRVRQFGRVSRRRRIRCRRPW